MTTLLITFLAIKESRRIRVNLDALKGTCSAFSSIALMHSFKASKLNYSVITFYLSQPLTFGADGCCFEYLEPFHFQLSRLVLISLFVSCFHFS